MKVFALDLFLQISRVFSVSLEAELFGICLSSIVDTLMMMHVEFNRIFFLVASEHAGLHGRSLVPVSHVVLLAVGTSVYKTMELPSLIWMHVELLWDFFLSQNMQAYIVRSRVPDVPSFQVSWRSFS